MKLFISAVLLTLLFSACSRPKSEPAPATTLPDSEATFTGRSDFSAPLPEFSRPTLKGAILNSDSLKGNVTLINFWATWCGPCIVEIPELVVLQDEWSDKPFKIVGVSSDWEGFKVVAPFAEDFQVNYPILSDSDGTLGEIFGGVYGLPTTFLVDADGMVIRRYTGILPFADLRDDLETLIAKAPAQKPG